jgi:hypothetical protein
LVFESAILVEYKYIWESNTKADYLGVLVDFTFPRIEEELLKKLNLSDKKVDEGHGFIKYRNNDFSLTKNIGFSYLGVSLSEVEKRRIEIVMNHGLSQDELQETDLGNISIYIQRDPDSQKSENRFLIIEHGKLHKNRKEFEVLKELGERLPTKANYNTQVTSQKKDKDLEEKRQRLKRLTTQLANATSYITNLGDSIYNFRCEKRNCKEYIDPTNKRVIYRYSGRYSRRGNTYISENVLELVFDSGILVEYKYIRDYNSEEYYLKSLYKEKFLKIEEELLIKLNLTGKISAKGEDFIQYKNDDFLLTKKIGFSSVLGTDERNITIAINHGLSQDELKKTDLGTFGIYIERDPYSKKSDQRFLIIEHGKLHQKL